MGAVYLDNQIFYTPPAVLGATRTSHHASAWYADVSAVISGAPPIPPLPQDSHDPRHGGPGDSPDDALLVSDSESNCDDLDNYDDDRSDNTFPSLDKLLTATRNRVAATDKNVSATPSISGDSDANEPSITRAEPNDKYVSTQRQQPRSLEGSPPSSVSPRSPHEEQDQPVPASSCRPPCAGIPCQQGVMCPRHPRLSDLYQRARSRSSGDTESPDATDADSPCHPRSPHDSLFDNIETDCSSFPRQPSTKPGENTESLHFTQHMGQGGTLCHVSANAKSAMQSSPSQALVSPQRAIRLRRHRGTDDEDVYRPIEDSDAEHSDDDVRPRLRKRSRVNVSNLSTGRAAHQQRTHQFGADRLQRIPRTSRPVRRRNRPSLPSPPSSKGPASKDDTAEPHAAKFEEWPLGNAVFKRVTLDGITTFQLQFTWDPCLEHDRRHVQSSTRAAKSQSPTANSQPTLRRARYTSQDDAKICQLKKQGLSWFAIAEQLPGRSAPAIEARYYSKLKTPSRGRRRRRDTPRTPVVDDSDGEEWDVEEISNHRKPDGGGLEFLVKWKGGEETWEPSEYVAETEALDKYERLHGQVA